MKEWMHFQIAFSGGLWVRLSLKVRRNESEDALANCVVVSPIPTSTYLAMARSSCKIAILDICSFVVLRYQMVSEASSD